GAAIYRRSLCFVLAYAAHKLFPNTRLLVGHSLDYGYYYTIDTAEPITAEQISELKKEMLAIVEKDVPIKAKYLSYSEAVDLFEKLNLVETRKQLNYVCPPKILVNNIDDFTDLYFGPLVVSTGYLKVFDLMPYQEGFLLRFPASSTPDELPPFKDIPKLFNIYKKYKAWGKQLGVTSSASLNQLIHDGCINDFIDITETLQVKCISDIADKIHERGGVKVILIAGPSSSGKTTTSKKLALQLQALGYQPRVISLDNYYVGRDVNPKDENGNYDYECLEALDVNLLNENLIDLFDGKKVPMPSYDFTEGKRYYAGDTMQLAESDILIMEGIHGLNDKLTPRIPAEYKFKIYLSALTQLNLDDHNRIPTTDNRLIRRIVRDFNFRGKSAADTISMWDNVRAGERKHIFPFQGNADAMLNTALDYELGVLKVYAEPLLRCVNPLQKEYGEASRLLRFLTNFSPIPSTDVPDKSIIREFIGGSAFHY
ncbi:MAG: nucleoside kinase, partial [Treponema sp.]|nr:nucleoside kinase [Treponema sp.]